mmetsp:Transcript_14539/g.32780  ORF Transcript_14539/g.32780 Transcript_14539/m.32780 type:complete len:386 (-) Transcript_14539:161-1318(-)
MAASEVNAIVPLATNYARIRASVAPFSIVGFVAQSFCLTTLDVKTPAIAMAAASVVNIIGDLLLSPKYGIQGAAVATALATVTSCCILLRKVKKTTSEWKVEQEELELEQATDATDEAALLTSEATITAGMDDYQSAAIQKKTTNEKSDTSRDIPFWSIPDKKSLINIFKLAGPIFFVMMAKVACYGLMTVRATGFGMLPLATHNIMLRVYFFFHCFGDALSQAAQSFYPQVGEKDHMELIKRLFYITSLVAIFNNQVSKLILGKLGRFLTKDANIIAMMAQHAPLVGMAVSVHPFIMLLEGTLLARRDLVFMLVLYTLSTLLHIGLVFSPMADTFLGLWNVIFIFQAFRLFQFSIRFFERIRASRKTRLPIGSAEQDAIPVPPL